MLNVIRCPNCEKKLKTDQGVGQAIPCLYCKEPFTIGEDDVVVPDPQREMLLRLAIPLGYVLFVAVPLGLTLLYFATRDEKRAVADAPAVPEERRPAPRPAPKPSPRKEKKPNVPEPTDPDPAPVRPHGPDVEVAPEPREVPEPVEVFVAPEPREAFWNLRTLHDSPWQKFGAVDLRIAKLGVGPVPVIDGKERVRETPQPMLVVVVEVRVNVDGKKRELESWTYGQLRYSAAFTANNKELATIDLPLGSKAHTGLPLKQPLPADGQPVRDVVVFAAPPDGAGEVSIRLDAERVGEKGDIWFKVPADVFKR